MVEVEGLCHSEAPGLPREIAQYAPAAVAEPGGNYVADHLVGAACVDPCKGHTIVVRYVTYQAVSEREIDLRVGRVDVELLAPCVKAEELAVCTEELAVAVAESNLPVPLGCVAAGHHAVRFFVVKVVHDQLGGIHGACRFFHLAHRFFVPLCASLYLAEACALVNNVEVSSESSKDPAYHQWFGVLGNPQGVSGLVAGQDAPDAVGVGVVVQHSRQLVHGADEPAVCLFWLCDEAGVVWHQLTQERHGFLDFRGVLDELAVVLLHEGVSHFPPLPVAVGLVADDDGIGAERLQGRRWLDGFWRLPSRRAAQPSLACQYNTPAQNNSSHSSHGFNLSCSCSLFHWSILLAQLEFVHQHTNHQRGQTTNVRTQCKSPGKNRFQQK